MKLTDYQPAAARKILEALLRYDAGTGNLHWLVGNRSVNAGDVAGAVNSGPYVLVKVDGERYRAHVLIWLLQTGEWPTLEIDHIDRNEQNNRWNNLRQVPPSVNRLNRNPAGRSDNTTGYLGVTQKGPERFVAQVKGKYLGTYHTAEIANTVAIKARAKLIQELTS